MTILWTALPRKFCCHASPRLRSNELGLSKRSAPLQRQPRHVCLTCSATCTNPQAIEAVNVDTNTQCKLNFLDNVTSR